MISAQFWADIVKGAGGSRSEAARRVVETFSRGLKTGKFKAEDVCLGRVASGMGLIDPYDIPGSIRRLGEGATDRTKASFRPESLYSESTPIMSNAFQTVCQELISAALIEGYNGVPSVADRLVTTQSVSMRNTKVAGFTHLGNKFEVPEGHEYPTIRFGEKWVAMKETKFGGMIELTEELLGFDQTGQIVRLARNVGEGLRMERERDIIRGVADADHASGVYVYRPSGVGAQLYTTAHQNYIGAGGITGFDAAVPLVDWRDIDKVLQYRATKVVDDRIDGTPRPIGGLNNGSNILLVPEAKRSTAWYIKNATGQERNSNDTAGTATTQTNFPNPAAGFIGEVLSTPYLDEVSAADYYYGDFRRQFVWSEIWPLQSFVQGADSDAAFETDTVLRVKARYYGGLSALDTIYVTQIDGA